METENMVRAAENDNFLIQHTDFSLREQVNYPNGGYSRFYDNGIDIVIIYENICDHTPVSYTHLDVYKRQLLQNLW